MECKICGITEESMFYASIGTYCKEHWKEKVKKNREDNKEHYLAYDKKRSLRKDRIQARKDYFEKNRNDPEWQAKRRKSREEWWERNYEKKIAHNKTRNAIRDGKLKKESCEVCGSKKVEAHHDDYSKPLEVRWLCKKHHMEHHRNTRK